MRNSLKNKPKTKEINSIPEKPEWLKKRIQFSITDSELTRKNIEKNRLHTVCESATCPNLNQCWTKKTATYMLSGDICTRKCKYCDVAFGKPLSLDVDEPERVSESVKELGLNYVVITSVNRDDLEDGGASQFYNTVLLIRKNSPNCKIELLIPDFKGNDLALDIIYNCNPNIINHNIETVKRLFPEIAPGKNYETSLNVLKKIKENKFISKSGIMLGLGETIEEVKECLVDLRNVGVSMVTIGQYLQPSPSHYPVKSYIKEEVFKELKIYCKTLGFSAVASAPYVRSSYFAEEQSMDYKSDI